jgi:hypothetical protein
MSPVVPSSPITAIATHMTGKSPATKSPAQPSFPSKKHKWYVPLRICGGRGKPIVTTEIAESEVLSKKEQRKQNQIAKKQADAQEHQAAEATIAKKCEEPYTLPPSALGPFDNFAGGKEFFCTGAISGDDDATHLDPEDNTATVC